MVSPRQQKVLQWWKPRGLPCIAHRRVTQHAAAVQSCLPISAIPRDLAVTILKQILQHAAAMQGHRIMITTQWHVPNLQIILSVRGLVQSDVQWKQCQKIHGEGMLGHLYQSKGKMVPSLKRKFKWGAGRHQMRTIQRQGLGRIVIVLPILTIPMQRPPNMQWTH